MNDLKTISNWLLMLSRCLRNFRPFRFNKNRSQIPQAHYRYNEYFTNLVFSVHTVLEPYTVSLYDTVNQEGWGELGPYLTVRISNAVNLKFLFLHMWKYREHLPGSNNQKLWNFAQRTRIGNYFWKQWLFQFSKNLKSSRNLCGQNTENPVLWSFFAPQTHGNACYAG